MTINIKESFCFDDLLLKPCHSDIKSRSEINLEVSFKKSGLLFNHPIVPANMKSIIGLNLAKANLASGGLTLLHRFMSHDEQLDLYRDLEYKFSHIGISIGVKEYDKELVKQFINMSGYIICIDIAHGDSKHCMDMICWIKNYFPQTFVIAGNIATREAAARLWHAGADMVKSSVGGGSVCSTRIETGNGVPTLSAIMEIAEYKRNKPLLKNKYIMADGGLRNAGDCVKSLCFADMIMAGNIFAGCPEAPGEIIVRNGKSYKKYEGSSTLKNNHIEGVSGLVPCKPPFKDIVNKLLQGISSGCSYQGCRNLSELKENPEFIKISGAGLKESHPHDLEIL